MHSPLHSVTPTLQQATTEPLPETAAHSWASLSQSLAESLLLSPGSWCSQGSAVPSKSLFPQSCVSSGGSMVGLMATSSKRAYATPRFTAPRALPLRQATPACTCTGDTQRCIWLSLCGLSWLHNVLFEPSECLWRVRGLILNAVLPLLPSSSFSPSVSLCHQKTSINLLSLFFRGQTD